MALLIALDMGATVLLFLALTAALAGGTGERWYLWLLVAGALVFAVAASALLVQVAVRASRDRHQQSARRAIRARRVIDTESPPSLRGKGAGG